MTSPIKWAVASGNGNKEFYRKRQFQISKKPQSPQCQIEDQFLSSPGPPYFFIAIYLSYLGLYFWKPFLGITLAEVDEEFSGFFNINNVSNKEKLALNFVVLVTDISVKYFECGFFLFWLYFCLCFKCRYLYICSIQKKLN